MQLMQNGVAPRSPQREDDVTYAPTIKKEDARIDWTKSAVEIANQVRAFNPRPLAWCEWRGEPLKIWSARVSAEANPSTLDGGTILDSKSEFRVATRDGVLSILEVQPSGKPKMNALDWARGARLEAGQKLE
jgi:methionyl-tRNA formyltransferase